MFHNQSLRKYWVGIELTTTESAIELTTDCATGPSHCGVPIYQNGSWIQLCSFGSQFVALFDCFVAILYEVLIAGPMDLVYQSDTYH